MASIDASTSGAGGIITTADNTGTLNLQSGGATIATINSTGLSMASGKLLAATGPAFSATKNTNQSITSSTFTKITFQVEDYDTNNNFASSTFTPTVAGYYLIGAGFNAAGGGAPTRTILDIYKNGSQVKRLFDTSTRCDNASGSVLLYLNGSTDYLEVYAYIVATSPQIYGSGSDTFFTGVLVRAA